jgi:parallel beta-helix repeat protein
MGCLLTVLVFTLSLTPYTFSKVWEVPGHCSTIQEGLDSCLTSDTVLVAPGIYYENLIWPNTHSICLISEFGADSTVIDGDSSGTVIIIESVLDSTTLIKGFTIRNGYLQSGMGGGIYCGNNSGPIISYNLITDNIKTESPGGGIFCDNSSPIISNNIITDNHVVFGGGGGIACVNNSDPSIVGNTIDSNSSFGGGGILCDDSSPLINDNIINSNLVHWFTIGGQGAGIKCKNNSSPTISNNIITYNTRGGSNAIGGGIYLENSTPTISNCTITNNDFDGIVCWPDASFLVTDANYLVNYNNIFDNVGYGVRNNSTGVTIDALNNWWGHPSGPSGVGQGSGDEVSEWVDYEPWLINPVTEMDDEFILLSSFIYQLIQNYPNPFNPVTIIKYNLPVKSQVDLVVYNTLGENVKQLVNSEKEAGQHSVEFNAVGIPSGIYFYRLQAGSPSTGSGQGFVETKKMVLMK